jgi:hypothetical protein
VAAHIGFGDIKDKPPFTNVVGFKAYFVAEKNTQFISF